MNVLFDLDGTLTDPREGIVGCMRYALEQLGLTVPTDAVLSRCIGPALRDSFRKLLGPEHDSDVEAAVALYRERFSALGIYENRVYPGIMPMLHLLYERGDTLFVATSKPREFAVRVVEHFALAPFLLEVFGSEMDGTRSDKADLLRHVLMIESLPPTATVMVGDRKHDIHGARAVGIPAIGVLWGYGSRQELQRAGAVATCAVPGDVPSVLNGIELDSTKHLTR